MKNLFILLFLLALTPVGVWAGNPAPYTDDALQKINKAIKGTPMPEPVPETAKEDVHRQNVAYFSEVFGKAGYSFTDTIDRIVDDMKNNPKAIPEDRETVYNKVYVLLHILMYQCDADQVDCLGFYPAKTAESIKWFRENSGFKPGEHHRENNRAGGGLKD
ncbi:MAG: hypothetical protein ACOY3O_11975 [Thermodesulfobacteriota bacterium]